jgi:predicted permease
LLNPVILAAIGGILFNLSRLPLPEIADRFLMILSGMALPLGLLLIGSGISPSLLRRWLPQAFQVAFFKLFLLPAVAVALFRWGGIESANLVPVIILLAAPTATLTYVMAREMGGHVDLAVAAVSLTTMLSAFSYALWLGWLTA